MTLVLDFSEKTNPQQLAQLGEWLKGMGLVKSFRIAPETFSEPDTDIFIDEMLLEAEEDFANGRTYTSDEAKKELEKWLQERK